MKTALRWIRKIPESHYTHIEATVSGGFYGKNAIEMGGSFLFDSGKCTRGENKKKHRWYSVRNANSLCNKHGCRTIENKASDGTVPSDAV
ncbi:transferrin-binding protein-like solute binding protein [Neisseria meningitidis]